MNTKKITNTLLQAILIFGIFLIPSVLFNNLSFARFILSNVTYLVLSGVLSLIFAFIIRKNKILGGLLILVCLLFMTSIVLFINMMERQDAEEVEWNAPNDRFTIDFTVGKQGYIYLKASVNDTSGLFLFDTGAAITHVNEKFVADKKMKFRPFSIYDSKGLEQTKNLYKANKFQLGELNIKRLHVYPNDSLTWTAPEGTFYQQDSVIGIIGNNIVSKFIWDFDMINKRVTISNSKKYCRDIPDSLSVPLFSNNGNKDIPVKINGAKKMLTFDFGASSPLSLSDSIPNQLAANKKGYSRNTIGILNHLDSMKKENSYFEFVDVELGAFNFHDIACSENDHSDLLGIPFMWTFERVIVDYMNDKAYFINQNDRPGGFSLMNFNHENVWKFAKVITFNAKPKGMLFSYKKDNIETRLVFYGRVTLFQNISPDSIFYQDSVLLTNGQIKYGPSTFRFKK